MSLCFIECVLLHLIDVAPLDGSDPVDSAKAIVHELESFDPDLINKPRWPVLNKIDNLPGKKEREQVIESIITRLNWQGPVFAISALNKEGTEELCFALMQLIDQMNEAKT